MVEKDQHLAIQALEEAACMLCGLREQQAEPDALLRVAQEINRQIEALALDAGRIANMPALLTAALMQIDALYAQHGGLAPVPDDAAWCGEPLDLQPGRLSLLSGWHAWDKALSTSRASCVEGSAPVLLFAMGEEAAELGMRLCGQQAGIALARLRTGRLADADWTKLTAAVNQLAERPLSVVLASSLSVPEIVYQSRREARAYGGQLGLIVIAHAQTIPGLQADYFRFPLWMGLLKSLARELSVPILLLHDGCDVDDLRAFVREVDIAFGYTDSQV